MNNIMPFFTLDGSVGLFDGRENDIFHSVYGALNEAYDKFILPANFNDFFKINNKIRILDLCYGIGYNSKSFLNYFFQNFVSLTENNDKIYTNNILNVKYNDKIYSDNNLILKYNKSIYDNKIFLKFALKKNKNQKKNNFNFKNIKLEIDAVDINENLVKISPLLKTKSLIFKNKKTGIEKVDKYLFSGKKCKHNYKLIKEVNKLILMSLIDKYGEDYLSADFCRLIKDKNWNKFLSKDMCRFMKFYISSKGISSSYNDNLSFLHNIYYEYISKSYKNTLKILENNKISFNSIIDDARTFLLSNNNTYDFIFLDAFTPSKCPNLWTYDFFKLLYSHLSENGKILTYSNSASVRNAFLKNNFYIGKIYNDNEEKYTGTVAVKNPNYIKYELSDYDYGLLNTKAGIMYRDDKLDDSNENILKRRKSDFEQSSLISATKYINNYKGDKNEI